MRNRQNVTKYYSHLRSIAPTVQATICDGDGVRGQTAVSSQLPSDTEQTIMKTVS